jgi:hypothetical protein
VNANNRTRRSSALRAPLVAALTLGALTGCSGDDAAVFIEGVLVKDAACTVSSAGTVFRAGGTYDIAGAQGGYNVGLKVRTNLPSTFNSGNANQSPNYPNYGPVDNNVVVFDSAVVEYTLAVDVDTGTNLETFTNKQIDCETSEDSASAICTIKPRTVTASGTVFNPQSSLNTAGLVATELVPKDLAEVLQAAFEGVGALQAPGDTARLTATVSLVGSTTGSGEYRKLTSFPLPFPIDLCVGCLVASDEFCEAFDAVAVETNAPVCDVGQDTRTSSCFCFEKNNAGAPAQNPPTATDTPVLDADSCDGGN